MTDTPDDLLAAGSSERRWRRRSLLALILAVPATMALSGYEDIRDLAHGHEWFPTAVAAGAEGHYAGADWRLETVEVVSDRAQRAGLPPTAAPVRVRFAVTIRDAGIGDGWLPCRVTLADGQGRGWSSAGFGGLPPSGKDVKSCNGATLAPHQPGDVLKIEESFVVPKAVAASLQPTVSVQAERPWSLRFDR